MPETQWVDGEWTCALSPDGYPTITFDGERFYLGMTTMQEVLARRILALDAKLRECRDLSMADMSESELRAAIQAVTEGM